MEEETRKFIGIMARYGTLYSEQIEDIVLNPKSNNARVRLNISDEDVEFVEEYFNKLIEKYLSEKFARAASWR